MPETPVKKDITFLEFVFVLVVLIFLLAVILAILPWFFSLMKTFYFPYVSWVLDSGVSQ